MPLNLADLFFRKAGEQPDRPLILGQPLHGYEAGRPIAYGEFASHVKTLAGLLRSAGLQSGENVGLLHRSGADYIAFVYAVWSCGACVTPLPAELTTPEKKQVLESIHVDRLIAARALFDGIRDSTVGEATDLTRETVLATVRAPRPAPPAAAAVNAAFIRFTSGTTGSAKGVVLSHEAVYERIRAANEALAIDERDNVVWLLSMDYHFTVSVVAYLTYGAGIILPKNTFGETVLAAAAEHKGTVIYGSPVHYNLMVQDETGASLPAGLRLAIVTTSALRSEIADAFYARFGRVLNETYGIIELGLPAINTSQSQAKQGSVGKITPGYEVRLDREPGEEEGEILLRGDGMLDAYYLPWKAREQVLREGNGWFRTGDAGRMDEDGYLYIVGRMKEMISVGGMKFFPEEVESVLERHPAVETAVVFGIEQRHWGETSAAQLVRREGEPEPDAAELRAHCAKYLADHKIPGRFAWTSRVKYTASGKKIRNRERALVQHQ